MIASARDAHEPSDAGWMRAFAFVAVVSARRCACATSESRRSATQRTPVARAIAAAIRWVDGGRRRRDDDVDPVLRARAGSRPGSPSRPRSRSRRDDEPPQLKSRLRERALEPLRAREHLGGLAAADADVAGAVHPRLRRDAQAVVAMEPARVVGREDVRLDPHRGQVLRELERPLHAAAAGGWEVEADDQGLHGRRS